MLVDDDGGHPDSARGHPDCALNYPAIRHWVVKTKSATEFDGFCPVVEFAGNNITAQSLRLIRDQVLNNLRRLPQPFKLRHSKAYKIFNGPCLVPRSYQRYLAKKGRRTFCVPLSSSNKAQVAWFSILQTDTNQGFEEQDINGSALVHTPPGNHAGWIVLGLFSLYIAGDHRNTIAEASGAIYYWPRDWWITAKSLQTLKETIRSRLEGTQEEEEKEKGKDEEVEENKDDGPNNDAADAGKGSRGDEAADYQGAHPGSARNGGAEPSRGQGGGSGKGRQHACPISETDSEDDAEDYGRYGSSLLLIVCLCCLCLC
jgi:hypothetical protein